MKRSQNYDLYIRLCNFSKMSTNQLSEQKIIELRTSLEVDIVVKMAGTLKPDPAFQKFNTARESMGTNFRLRPGSIAFNVVAVGLIPAALTYYAYATEGQFGFHRQFRKDPVLYKGDYVPRDKDL